MHCVAMRYDLPCRVNATRPARRRGPDHTLKMAVYLALIASAWVRIAAGSSFMNLMSASGRRPGLGLAWRCGTYRALRSTSACWPSREHIQFWNSRAAFGLGAALKTALGLLMRGAPSTG